jgi:hypothetical protein
MAKRSKKTKGIGNAVPTSSERISADISAAENGFTVNISGETGGGENSYFSKRYIATSKDEAIRIASSGLAGGRKAGKKKVGGKKKIALKRG